MDLMEDQPDKTPEDNAYEQLRKQVREALAPVLGVKPYMLIVDASTLDDLKTGDENIYIITPEYQRGILTRGLLYAAKDIETGGWSNVGGGD